MATAKNELLQRIIEIAVEKGYIDEEMAGEITEKSEITEFLTLADSMSLEMELELRYSISLFGGGRFATTFGDLADELAKQINH